MIPNPLHPAIVHFPIVLILIGTMVAVAAIFLQRWHLPFIAAGLLTAGAIGALAATWTGGKDQELAGELPAQAEQILDEHEEWGEATRNTAIGAAILACAAFALGSRPRIARGVVRGIAAVAAMAALSSSYCVVQTGHYGGQLVYKHGIGINTLAANNSAAQPPKSAKADKDDDD